MRKLYLFHEFILILIIFSPLLMTPATALSPAGCERFLPFFFFGQKNANFKARNFPSKYCGHPWTTLVSFQLTKSSPESAPTEVMDSLLIVRGMRTLLRGAAAAASSAIFFFNLANIAFTFSVSFSVQCVASQGRGMSRSCEELSLAALRTHGAVSLCSGTQESFVSSMPFCCI